MLTILSILVYIQFGKSNTKFGINLVNQLYYSTAYLIICLLIVHKFHRLIHYLIPFSIIFFLFMGTKISTAEDEYKFSEFMMSPCLISNLLIVILPSQWKVNSIAFTLGMLHVCFQMYSRYGQVSTELFLSTCLCSVYFF